MGCDIHAHIEVMINGKWEHYSCPNLKRNYAMFEKICGVRGKVERAISPPRGLPKDLNIVTFVCFNYESPDAHNMTWLSRMELDELIKWVEQPKRNPNFQHEELGYLTGNTFNAGEGNPLEITDVRFICWFDN